MLRKFYWITGGAFLTLYGLASLTGWEWGTPRRETLPPGVRQAPGGYRSYHFWHSGYRGGK